MDGLKLSQDYYVYTPKKSAVYPITESDWNRIKKMLGNVIVPKKVYSFFSSLCFGITASSIFSFISFITIEKIPNWIIPTNISIGISSLILAIILLILDEQQKDIIKISSHFIIEEMESIESKFEE